MFDHFNLLQMNNYLNLLNLLLTLSCFLKHCLTIYYYYFSQTCFGKEGVELKVSQLKWLVHTVTHATKYNHKWAISESIDSLLHACIEIRHKE